MLWSTFHVTAFASLFEDRTGKESTGLDERIIGRLQHTRPTHLHRDIPALATGGLRSGHKVYRVRMQPRVHCTVSSPPVLKRPESW